jgi:hypothetical protein
MVENKARSEAITKTFTKAEMFEYNKQQRVAFIKSKMARSTRRN